MRLVNSSLHVRALALAYAEAMMSSRLMSFASFAAAFAAAAAAYASRGTILSCGCFVVLCAVFMGLGWRSSGKVTRDGLRDPSISTLVFPPESKFQPSVLPPR
jgi:membrane protein implicated in regulation of membrane protease activity